MNEPENPDPRLSQYLALVEKIKNGDYELGHLVALPDPFGQALCDLAAALKSRSRRTEKLEQVVARINAGFLLEDTLDYIYTEFREIIPYNRLGLALLEEDNQWVRAHWARSDQPQIKLQNGYRAPVANSSLAKLLESGAPRILNDLAEYLEKHPDSQSTRLMVEEGIRSSLTCPLLANGLPVGFLFFSSVFPNTYNESHVHIFNRIAAQVSILVEKGRFVSELARQKAEIEEQNKILKSLNEQKTTFMGIAAHDLRSPISFIKTTTDLLLDDDTGEYEQDRRDLLVSVANQAHHVLVLLNELLDLTEIDSGELNLSFETFDLSKFLEDVVRDQSRLAATKGTQIDLERILPLQVMADKIRLNQVLDNLISNAVKFSPPGSIIQVRARPVESGIRLEVQDQGPGIQERDRQRLFQPFARLSARPTGREKSTGLGLAITHRIVEAHGGQIDVDSVPGQGSVFWFTLPMRASQET